MRTAILILAYLAHGAAAAAEPPATRVSTQDELGRAIAAARPGDRIVIAPGEYRGFSAMNLQGTSDKPILIHGDAALDPPRFTSQIHLSDPTHLELAHLTIVGAPANGLNIDDGGSFDTPAHHIALRGLIVADGGGKDNADGIKLSGVTDFNVQDCAIERWGRGGSGIDMVGCARGVIELCTLRDRTDDPASSGVQAKGGSRDIAIRKCRFEHAGQRAVNIGGSTGMAFFRPKPEGFEARDIVVEGCTFVGSQSPIAFVGVDGATVRWNTFYLPSKWILRILQETTAPEFVPCRNGVFSDNLIVFQRANVAVPVNVGGNTAPETFTFARNYWYAVDDPARSIPTLPRSEEQPAGGADPRMLDPRVADPRLGNFGVPADSPARQHGAGAWPGQRKPGMVLIPAGEFTMGTDDANALPNEHPALQVRLDAFWIDEHDVTNGEFRKFVEATGYLTTAEKPVDWEELKKQVPPGTPKPADEMLQPGSLVFTPPDHAVDLANMGGWWTWTTGANWRHPQGPASSIEGKDDFPVVQVSWDDATAYATWAGKRLPTEAEWEYASRGGREGTRYNWGNELQVDGKFMCNTFTGEFPWKNTAADGFAGVSPVKSFPPNGYGLFDMAGNVWNWTADLYRADAHALALAEMRKTGASCCINPKGPALAFDPTRVVQGVPERVIKGGSYLCNPTYCESYRPTARRGTPPDTGSTHVGFRCASASR